MTTIAWNDEVIAWDSQQTSGSDVKYHTTDKVRVVGKKIYALSGTSHLFDVLIAWEKAGGVRDDFPEYPDSNAHLFVFTEKETLLYLHGYKDIVANNRRTAGSGGDLALAAIRAGADPIKAVEIAATLDVYSSLPVNSLRFADVFAPTSNVSPLRRTSRIKSSNP